MSAVLGDVIDRRKMPKEIRAIPRSVRIMRRNIRSACTAHASPKVPANSRMVVAKAAATSSSSADSTTAVSRTSALEVSHRTMEDFKECKAAALMFSGRDKLKYFETK